MSGVWKPRVWAPCFIRANVPLLVVRFPDKRRVSWVFLHCLNLGSRRHSSVLSESPFLEACLFGVPLTLLCFRASSKQPNPL